MKYPSGRITDNKYSRLDASIDTTRVRISQGCAYAEGKWTYDYISITFEEFEKIARLVETHYVQTRNPS